MSLVLVFLVALGGELCALGMIVGFVVWGFGFWDGMVVPVVGLVVDVFVGEVGVGVRVLLRLDVAVVCLPGVCLRRL